jgi:hypothetical protein
MLVLRMSEAVCVNLEPIDQDLRVFTIAPGSYRLDRSGEAR